jgi:hypothetical protein
MKEEIENYLIDINSNFCNIKSDISIIKYSEYDIFFQSAIIDFKEEIYNLIKNLKALKNILEEIK